MFVSLCRKKVPDTQEPVGDCEPLAVCVGTELNSLVDRMSGIPS